MKIEAASVEHWRYALDRPVGGSGVQAVDLIVVDLTLTGGVHGMGFGYVLGGNGEVSYLAARQMVERFVTGQPLMHPQALWRQITGSLNRAGRGPNQAALAAIDVAAWDAYAKHLDVSVGIAMGGVPRRVPVYGSGFFNTAQSPEEAAEAARIYLRRGVAAVKPRVSGQPGDAALLSAVADVLGDKAHLMVDANERCDLATATWLVRVAAEAGALFVEEPLPSTNYAGYRALAATAATGIALGEHLQGSVEAAPFLLERVCTVMQPDLQMMGGLSECLRVAHLAEHCGIAVTPHFLPALFVHVAAAAPNVTWLEDFPLLEPLFDDPQTFDATGHMTLPDVKGHGLVWAAGARQRCLVSAG